MKQLWWLLSSLCLMLTALSQQSCASETRFIFNNFHGANLSLGGIAAYDNGLVRLTNISARLFGRALYPNPVQVKNGTSNLTSSFSTTFVFAISPLYSTIGGHGMAFIMTPSLDDSGAFPSQYLGILNSTNNGNPSDHVFAVEFDTVMDLEFDDIDDNHVGINLNSMKSNYSASAGYWTASKSKIALNLKGGQELQAWIQYDGFTQQLNVSVAPLGISQPTSPLMSVQIDLSYVLEDYMYVGFSGSTGVISGIHRVLSWSFNSNGPPQDFDFSKLPSINPKASWYRTKHFVVAITISCAALLVCICGITAFIWRKWRQNEVVEDWELEFGLHRYSYRELRIATQKFSDKELIGKGGFGHVYRGVLPTLGAEVAVKRLSRESRQGEREFIAEMSSVGQLRHRNLVQLLGWSRGKGELLLVYEYMPNGSLDKWLFRKSPNRLTWQERYKILRGVAEGMLYLHEGWEQQVIHRDIKVSNVLLDAEMNGRLGDFGLARLYEHGQNPHTTRVVGTLGYLAPEFARSGKATTSTDVYSFGVVLLEVATGKRPMDRLNSDGDSLLVDRVWNLYVHGNLLAAVDPRLGSEYDTQEMQRVLLLGLLCCHHNPSARPAMRYAVQVLDGDADLAPLPTYTLSQVEGAFNLEFPFSILSSERSDEKLVKPSFSQTLLRATSLSSSLVRSSSRACQVSSP